MSTNNDVSWDSIFEEVAEKNRKESEALEADPAYQRACEERRVAREKKWDEDMAAGLIDPVTEEYYPVDEEDEEEEPDAEDED